MGSEMCEGQLMTHSLKVGLFASVLVFAASPALAIGWETSPWPVERSDGSHYCYLAYAEEPRAILIIASGAAADDFRLSIADPAFAGTINDGEVSFVFPSGWQVSTPFVIVAPGHFAVGIDEVSFHRVLDELETPGTWSISTGGSSIEVPVSDDLDYAITRFRGPVGSDYVLGESCVEQLSLN